jgi:argininosuccinate synthase
MKQKCLLAYSGGLDTSAIIPWLRQSLDYDVIAYCCNLGNLPPANELRERALRLGAIDFIYEDAQDEFSADFVFPLIRANATYFEDYLLGTAIARPLIADRVAKMAKDKGVSAIAHGATGKGNDHIRFEKAWAYLCPNIKIIAPWKIWDFKGREELVTFLKENNYDWQDSEKRFSIDVNSFHRSCEGGVLEKLDCSYQKNEVLGWVSPEPMAQKTQLKISIHKGFATAINGLAMSPFEILNELNKIGSNHGIGVCDIVEERTNGIKSRGVYETPAGTILHQCLKALKQLCWTRELYLEAQKLSDSFGLLVYDGLWFGDLKKSVDAFFASASEALSGEIFLSITNNHIQILSRFSPCSLYSNSMVSFESDEASINKAAQGYMKIKVISDLQQGLRKENL